MLILVNTVDEAIRLYNAVLKHVKEGHSKNKALTKVGKHLASLQRIQYIGQLSILRPSLFDEVKSFHHSQLDNKACHDFWWKQQPLMCMLLLN